MAIESFTFSGLYSHGREPMPSSTRAPWFSDYDLYLLGEGTHYQAYEKMGAHVAEVDGQRGVHFAVWAPNARDVSVVGEFNGWKAVSGAPSCAQRTSPIRQRLASLAHMSGIVSYAFREARLCTRRTGKPPRCTNWRHRHIALLPGLHHGRVAFGKSAGVFGSRLYASQAGP